MERSDGVEISPHCQRCGSTNTKFCYYNNYSLTQPRYFCKGCRRYWTKGGSLRNVPVGGGCRKNSRRGSCISISRYHRKSPSKPPLGYSSINASCVTRNSSSSSAPNIDLAQVYANFLKQEPEPAKNLPKDRPEDSTFEAREARTRPVSGPGILESQWEDYNRPFELPDEEGPLFSHTADWFGSELAAPAAHTLPDDFGQACHDINQLVDGWSPFDFPI